MRLQLPQAVPKHAHAYERQHAWCFWLSASWGARKFPFLVIIDDGGKFNSGGNYEYFLEETKYEEAYIEEHVVGAGTAKVDGMRYQHHHYLDGDTCYVSPYDKNKIKNIVNT
ncbi:hypothetical protein CR513_25317, partial [Mucuna pruriens]